MTDLLTKEERETVERIRKTKTAINREFDEEEQLEEAKDYDRLIAIIDNLSKRGVKKYSEEELRAGFETTYRSKLPKNKNGKYIANDIECEFSSWLECARFLGAMEEKCQT